METITGERRAVVIEDDDDVRSLISFTLGTQGFEVTAVETGLDGVEAVRTLSPDLVTLDIGLPGIDGIETCRRIRQLSDAYVVMITARDDEIDRLIGLETGADDYLSKPFSVRELKARVNALFRRPRHPVSPPSGQADAVASPPMSAPPSAPSSAPPALQPLLDHELLEHGSLRLDVDGRRAYHADDELELTRTEFDLLTELMRTPARVWTREALLRAVWGTEWGADTHLVEVHVGNLRRKLTKASGAALIHTVRGVGYRMESI